MQGVGVSSWFCGCAWGSLVFCCLPSAVCVCVCVLCGVCVCVCVCVCLCVFVCVCVCVFMWCVCVPVCVCVSDLCWVGEGKGHTAQHPPASSTDTSSVFSVVMAMRSTTLFRLAVSLKCDPLIPPASWLTSLVQLKPDRNKPSTWSGARSFRCQAAGAVKMTVR